jgi:hypothetical protein
MSALTIVVDFVNLKLKAYGRARVGKHFSDTFPVYSVVERDGILSTLLFSFI